MPKYSGFYFDQVTIIEEALEFARETKDNYLLSRRSQIGKSLHKEIDDERRKVNTKIPSIIKLLRDAIDGTFDLTEAEFTEMINIIRSSLELFLLNLEAARSKANWLQ